MLQILKILYCCAPCCGQTLKPLYAMLHITEKVENMGSYAADARKTVKLLCEMLKRLCVILQAVDKL